MKNLLIILFFIISFNINSATIFKAFYLDNNILLSKNYADYENDYVNLNSNDSSIISIDNKAKIISIGSNKYEFIKIPKWNIKRTFKVCYYECIDLENLEKIGIYLFCYDKTSNWRLEVIHCDYSVGDNKDFRPSQLYNMRKLK